MLDHPPQDRGIQSQVKDPDLVARRRRTIVDAAVQLFIENGFHKTTTRQIAKAAGISIGALYEYIRSKEDILYLVCDAIHAEVEKSALLAISDIRPGKDALAELIRAYFLVCHRMSDHILLIYQETHSLPRKWRTRVLEKELRITGLFMNILAELNISFEPGGPNEKSLEMVAHNITVLGHMWTFRRWFFSRHFQIEDYIAIQTRHILNMITSSPATPLGGVNDVKSNHG